jgi:hypothetical protein
MELGGRLLRDRRPAQHPLHGAALELHQPVALGRHNADLVSLLFGQPAPVPRTGSAVHDTARPRPAARCSPTTASGHRRSADRDLRWTNEDKELQDPHCTSVAYCATARQRAAIITGAPPAATRLFRVI